MAEPTMGAGAGPDRWAAWLTRDVVLATGAESGSFLQGQLSQDLARLSTGESAWSWLLAPTGKVDALLRVQRSGEESWILDTDAGWGAAVTTRLQRFKLRTRVDFEPVDWRVLALRGDGWEPALWGGVVSAQPWPGVAGRDLFDPDDSLVRAVQAVSPLVGRAEVEVARILARIPAMGSELSETTIPAETGTVEETVSFDKGCYTGQELVARIDSRGSHVARRLRLVRLSAPAEPGTTLLAGDREAGILTSVASSSARGWAEQGRVGLAYIRRGFEPPMSLVAGPEGPVVEVPDQA